MTLKLKDIIDLDYFLSLDDALESEKDIGMREERDKRIGRNCRDACGSQEALLLSWLDARRQAVCREKEGKRLNRLPGTVFSSLYSFMVYTMIFSGSISGLMLAWSFLAYHGTKPVNVTLFIFLFIALQGVLILVTTLFLSFRSVKISSKNRGFRNSIIHTLLSSLFFHVLPELLRKTDSWIFRKGLDPLEYNSVLIRMKSREYKPLFFWPVFILVAIFAFCFTAGTLGGTFFRVMVSDMAFGWQSTLLTTSETIHDLVSWMAFPWSWFMPGPLAHPGLSQIEGSRIILKEGISVLATHDLVSWWPFLCLGILFYTVIPRGLLMAAGILSQYRVLRRFSLDRPVFRQLLIRMQSPVLDVTGGAAGLKRALPDQEDGRNSSSDDNGIALDPAASGTIRQTALILSPQAVYSDTVMEEIRHYIQARLFPDAKEMIRVSLDPEQDADVFIRIKDSDADSVVLVHEVWQPPIRGLLYYLRQLKSVMPEKMFLWILLTGDAGSEMLWVGESDINFEIWKKAVFKLQDPGIKIMRMR